MSEPIEKIERAGIVTFRNGITIDKSILEDGENSAELRHQLIRGAAGSIAREIELTSELFHVEEVAEPHPNEEGWLVELDVLLDGEAYKKTVRRLIEEKQELKGKVERLERKIRALNDILSDGS